MQAGKSGRRRPTPPGWAGGRARPTDSCPKLLQVRVEEEEEGKAHVGLTLAHTQRAAGTGLAGKRVITPGHLGCMFPSGAPRRLPGSTKPRVLSGVTLFSARI